MAGLADCFAELVIAAAGEDESEGVMPEVPLTMAAIFSWSAGWRPGSSRGICSFPPLRTTQQRAAQSARIALCTSGGEMVVRIARRRRGDVEWLVNVNCFGEELVEVKSLEGAECPSPVR